MNLLGGCVVSFGDGTGGRGEGNNVNCKRGIWFGR